MTMDAVRAAVIREVARRPWLGPFVLCLTAVTVALYGSEALLAVVRPGAYDSLQPVDAASRSVIYASFDRRAPMQVVLDLRAKGIAAYPFPRRTELARSYHAAVPVNANAAFALAGAARTLTVFCNESGTYPTYVSDRFGFNNPEGAWQHPRVDLALLGDSFIHGACVDAEHSVTSALRGVFPASLSFGLSGNGPLSDLAILREYVAPLRPQAVFWFYFPSNDFSDFEEERAEPALLRYLDPRYRQGLTARQDEIDDTQRQWLDGMVSEVVLRHDSRLDRIRAFMTLRPLRTLVSRGIRGRIPHSCSPDRVARFREVLMSAEQEVKGWGGRLYFVRLATWNDAVKDDLCAPDHAEVDRLVQALRLPLIEVAAAFARERATDSLWVARAPGLHYSPAGYAVMARALLDQLRRDGIEPSTP